MTELELTTRKKQLEELREQEKTVRQAIKIIEEEIANHYLDNAKKSFEGVNVGDKLSVIEQNWDGKYTQHKGYFYDVRYSRYSFNRPESIELVLRKVKKDGTMGQREETIYVRRIVDYEILPSDYDMAQTLQ